jgi:hypothetical protein
MIGLILLVFAFVCCTIAAFWYPGQPVPWSRPHLGWLGVALYFLSLILSGVGRFH